MSGAHVANGPANSAEAKKAELRMKEKKCCKSPPPLTHQLSCMAASRVCGCCGPTCLDHRWADPEGGQED